MDTRTDRLKNPATRLPDISLPEASGTETRIRRGRDAPVIIFMHEDCPDCVDYVEEVARHSAEIEEWSGRPIAISPTSKGAPTDLPIPVLIDADERLASAAGLRPPAIIIADQWGQIHERYEGAGGHDLPTPDHLVGDVRYLAIRCPECEGEAY